MTGTFDRVEVERLLGLLSVKLTDRRIAGKVYIVGGAAIALQHDGRRTTDDVDALAAPAGAVGAAAREVAAEEGLPDNWLNDAARAWIPPLPEGQSMDPGSDPGLGIETAPPEHLLAMKIVAQRGKRDMDDIVLLARGLRVSRAEDLYNITIDAYGEDVVEHVHGGLDDLTLSCVAIESVSPRTVSPTS